MSDVMLIVIPCLNEAANLPRLLTQFVADNPGTPIVVADGGSTDDSRAIIARAATSHPQIMWLENPDRLQAAGLNRAVATYGDGKRWLVRVDAHCDYPPDYAARLIATAKQRVAASIVVPMVSVGDSCFQRAAAAAQNSRLGTGGSPHRHIGTGGYVDHGHHALMAIDRFRAVGGYRADMPANEDAELDHRLRESGARIWLEPTLALRYHPRAAIGPLWRQYRGYGRGRATTMQIHHVRPKLRQVLPLLVPVAIALLPLGLLTPLALLPAAFWALVCLAAGFFIGGRHGGGCARFAGIAAMTTHLAWGVGFIEKWFGRRISSS
jgi:succinoglycan biosynthesis protein ExoA